LSAWQVGKTLVKAARDFGAPLRFVCGVTLEPDTVRQLTRMEPG